MLLQERTHHYQGIVEGISLFVWTAAPDGSWEYCNRAWHTYTGLTRPQSHSGWQRAIHPDDLQRVLLAWETAQNKQSSYEVEFRVRRCPDGVYRWFFARLQPIRDLRGNISRWLGGAVDIHERKEREEALRESEERYRLMVEGAIDYAIFTLDRQGIVTSWSSGAEKVLGYKVEDIVGKSGSIIFTSDDRRKRQPEIEIHNAITHGRAEDERWHCRKDRTRFWGSGLMLPLRNGQESLVGVVKILRDRTEQRLAELELQRFRLFVQNVRDYAIFMLDADGKITDWNEGAARIKGYAAEEVIGCHVSLFYTPEDKKTRLPQREMKTARLRGRSECEGWRVRKDGSQFWVNEIVTPLYDPKGRFLGFTKISRDLTDQKNVRDTLQKLNASLERRVTDRNQQVLRHQHELRAMAAQLGRTEVRERKRLAAELHDELAQLLALSELRLSALPVARITPELRKSISDVKGYVAEALSCARSLIADLNPAILEKRNVIAVVEAAAERMRRHGLKVTVRCDKKPKPLGGETLALLHHAVRELLMNVVKHSGVKRAQVALQRRDGFLEISVLDRGAGLKKTVREQNPTAEGGFGLFNLRERLDMLGGALEINDKESCGTRVLLKVPVLKEGESDLAITSIAGRRSLQEPTPARRSGKIRVLVADDHQMMREGLRKIIEEQQDLQVIGEASDGTAVVELARKLKPDVILMDINMPRLDGIEATRRIMVRRGRKPAIIGLSIQQDKDVATIFRNAGAAAYLAKGEAAATLCNVIRRLGGAKGAK